MRNWLSQAMGKEKEDEPERPLIEVVRDMIERNPEEWWVMHHFGWGMGMRNLLRDNGFSEKDMGVGNLDDYYIAFIEQACLGEGKNIHPLPTETDGQV